MFEFRPGMPDKARGHEWSLCTNRHPTTDGDPWGWIEARVPPAPPNAWWTKREVALWSGVEGRKLASAAIAENNATPAPAREPSEDTQ